MPAALALALVVGLGFFLWSANSFGVDLIAALVGAFYVGGMADSRDEALTGGAVFAGAGLFLGTVVSIPVGTAVAVGPDGTRIGVAVLVGFVFGLLYAVLFGVLGAVAGYAGARYLRLPK